MTARLTALTAFGISACLFALTPAGCELAALVDRSLIPLKSDYDPPTGGSGGAAGSGGTGGAAAGGGSGGCVPESCDQGTDCQQGDCAGDGSCILKSLPEGTFCSNSEGGAIYCDGAGSCSYQCMTEPPALDPDCPSKVCQGHVCLQLATCVDGSHNGGETDVDCGGSCAVNTDPDYECGTVTEFCDGVSACAI